MSKQVGLMAEAVGEMTERGDEETVRGIEFDLEAEDDSLKGGGCGEA